MKLQTLFFIAACFVGSSLSAQSAIKLKKQQTTFFYGQLNLHGGFVNDVNGDRWDFATRSPKNQINFQVVSKNKRNMQRGYTKLIAVDSWRFRIGLEYDSQVDLLGVKRSSVDFKLQTTYIKFKTKWDRTTLIVGNKSIPYGHNPKIDPVVSFMINPIKMDLGFAQDIGVFYKSPISKNLDIEIAITSGGFLSKPVLVCNNLVVNDESNIDIAPVFKFGAYDYQGTWLATSRIGSPTYKKNEFGLNLVAGHLSSTAIAKDISHIYRVGADWVFKYSERIKLVNQVIIGETSTSSMGRYISTNIMNNLDLYSGKNWMFSASHSINSMKAQEGQGDLYNWSLAGSLTYVVSPHTRIRLNSFYTRVVDANEKQCGVMLQFVSGIGKRP